MANFDNIIQEINTNLPDNNTQSITAAKLRTTLVDLTNTIDQVQDDFETEINQTITSNIVDNLDSNDTDKSLSANQGKVLKENGNTITLIGNNNSTTSDVIRCIENHKYRIYLERTDVSFSNVTYTSETYTLFAIVNFDSNLEEYNILYKRGCNDKVTPLRNYYDVVAVQNGYLKINIKFNLGEVLIIKVEDTTQSESEMVQNINNFSSASGYVNTSGGITSSNNFNYGTYVVDGYDYVRFLGLMTVNAASNAYAFYDTNNNVIYVGNLEYDSSLSSITSKEYVVEIPEGAYYFKTVTKYTALNSFTSNYYCYLGKIENNKEQNISREINAASELSGMIIWQNAISQSTRNWSTTGTHYIIPLLEDDKYITIKANSENSSYWTILKSKSSIVSSLAEFATGFTKNNELTANSEIEVIIPQDGKYLYIQATSTRIPQKLVISKKSTDIFDGVELSATNIQNNGYLNSSYTFTSNTNYAIYTFDVEDVKVIGINGRIASAAYCPFYDSENNVISYFQSTYDSSIYTDANLFNFNNTLNVPEGAKTVKISFAYNKGFVVKNCINMTDNETINLLSSKKVSFIGDSITYGFGLSNQNDRWTTVLSRNLARCMENNLGVSGSCLCSNTKNRTTHSDPVNADRFITRVSQATIGDSDIIFIWGGANDFSYDSKAIGDLFAYNTISATTYRGTQERVAPTDTDTFAGALHELLSTVRNINPDAKVIYLTIMNRSSLYWPAHDRPTSYQINANGNWIDEYNDTIKKICAFYAIPVIDINTLINQNWAYDTESDKKSMDLDGIHPNKLGHRRIAEIVFNYVINNRLV